MAVVTLCDRCKKDITEGFIEEQVAITNYNGNRTTKTYGAELCRQCAKALIDFIKRGVDQIAKD